MPGNPLWVWAEQREGRLLGVSLELLGKGQELSQRLGGELAAILIGERAQTLGEELLAYGAVKVYLVEDPRLALYQSDVYANIMADLIRRHQPEVLLLGATAIGMDLAPRVAAKVGTGLTAHCVDLYIEEAEGKPVLVEVVPGFGENLMVKIACPQKRPQMATVRPGVFEKPGRTRSQGCLVRVQADIRDEDFRARTVEMVEEGRAGISLEEADTVVCGGWGLQSAGGFKLIEALVGVLGGAVAGTRPAVDAGWVPEDRMIGQSGKTVSPKLFISVGASGAMHYTTGFLKSKVVLAIDQNPKAPIFEVSDLCIVGDLGKVVPALIEEFSRTE